MKKLVLAIIISVVAVAAIAQGPGPGGPGMGGPGGRGGGMKRMAEMQKKILDQLKLTADQKKKVDALDADTAKKLRAAMESLKPSTPGARPDFSQMREKIQPIRKAREAALAKILTKDQLKKYSELRKKAMDDMRKSFGGFGGPGGRGPGGPGGPPPGGGPGGGF